jgi:hypothetical protein
MRRQWRSVIAVALIAGLGGGFTLTAAAGARRASTAWDRLRAETLAPDLMVQARPGTDPALLDAMRRQAGVTGAGNFVYTPVAPEPTVPGENAGSFVALDDDFGTRVYRPLIESGRRADPRRADEVTVNRDLAKLGHFSPGQRVHLRSGYDSDHLTDLGFVTIVGIHKGLFDVGANAGNASMLLNRRFLDAHRDQMQIGPEPGGLIRLRDGYAGVARAQRQVHKVWGDAAFVLTAQGDETVVVDAVNVQVIALGLLAVAAGLATSVTAGQALGRLLSSLHTDAGVLRALGVRRRDLVAVGAAVATVVAVIAAAGTLTSAVLASPLMPTGLARKIEPDPGVRVDGAAFVVGALLLLMFLVGTGALFAWRGARRDGLTRRTVTRPLPPLSPAGALGAHWMAAATPAPAAASARSALAAAAVGTAGVVAVLTFAASLTHFLHTDRLYGWEFQGSYVAEPGDAEPFDAAVDKLAAERAITALARGEIVRLGVGGLQIETWAMQPIKGVVGPTLLTGRAPVGANEIVLGTDVLSHLHLAVGDSVAVKGGEAKGRFKVVGTAVFPEVGNASDLSTAALVTRDAWLHLGGEPSLDLAIVRGNDAATVEKLMQRYRPETAEFVGPFQPARVKNIKQVGSIPWLLALFFSLLALAAVVHALFLSVRHRQRDMAVLRSLGMLRRQLRRAVAAQAVATIAVGAAVGVPLGIAVGRLAWSAIADGLGVLNRPVVQAFAVLGAVAVGLVAAVLVAQLPATRATRTKPATLLRTE